jgi:predicted nucleotidyltransferase
VTAKRTLRRCKAVLADHYGQQLKGLVLYGSMARRQPRPGSDIDILVLLGEPFDYFRELRQIVDLLYPIQLDSDHLLSAKPALLDEYESGRIQLYRNAMREGVRL